MTRWGPGQSRADARRSRTARRRAHRWVLSALLLSLVVPYGAGTLARGSSPFPPAIGPAFPISEPGYAPAVADVELSWSGSAYLAVYQRDGDIYGARIDVDGTVLDPSGIPISTAPYDQLFPSVVWNGETWLVVWDDAREKGDLDDVYAARVTPEGAVLDPDGRRLARGEGLYGHSVVWTGSEYIVTWSLGCQVLAERLDGDASPLDAQPFLVSGALNCALYPWIAWGGSKALIVWQENGADIRGARLTEQGEVLDMPPIAVSTAPEVQYGPQVAWNGQQFLVAWGDYRNDPAANPQVYGTFVAENGDVVSPGGIAIGAADSVEHDLDRVVSNGSKVLVTWLRKEVLGEENTSYETAGALVDSDMVAPFVIASSSGFDFPHGAGSDGNSFLVFYAKPPLSLLGLHIDPQGQIFGEPVVGVVMVPAFQGSPALASGGESLFAVWVQTDPDIGLDWNVFGGRVNAQGEPLDGSGIRLTGPGVYEPASGLLTRVAFGGASYVVIHEEYVEDLAGPAIFVQRVTPEGSVLDAPPGLRILPVEGHYAPEDAQRCALASNGTGLLLACHTEVEGGPTPQRRLFLSRFSAGGDLLDPAGLFVPLPAYEGSRGIAAAWNGTAYSVLWGQYRADLGHEVVQELVIGEDGHIRGAAPRVLSQGALPKGSPVLSCAGAECLAAWRADTGDELGLLEGLRLDRRGDPIESQPFPVLEVHGGERSRVQWDGRDFVTVVHDDDAAGPILGLRVSGAARFWMIRRSFSCRTKRIQGARRSRGSAAGVR